MNKKQIYDLFTLKHNIKLTKESITLISENINDTQDLHELMHKYINKKKEKCINDDNFINIDLLQEILTYKCTMIEYKYLYTTILDHYTFLKSKYKDITLIKDIKPDIRCTIFGYLYQDKEGNCVLEDDSSCVRVENDSRVNIFIRIEGSLSDGIFKISEKKSIPMEDHKSMCCMENISSKRILIYNGTALIDIQEDNIYIILNTTMKANRSNVFIINDKKPRILKVDKLSICINNREVDGDIQVYLENYNFNLYGKTNMFYREEYDIHLLVGEEDSISKGRDKILIKKAINNKHIEIYQNNIKLQ